MPTILKEIFMNFSQKSPEFRKKELFESALLEHHRQRFEIVKKDDEKALHAAYRSPEKFANWLLQLENDLRLYLGDACIKNQGGQFLEETKKVVSLLYNKLPKESESEKALERILNLILDLYSKKEKDIPVEIPVKEETKEKEVEHMSEPELIRLANDLRLWLKDKGRDKEGRVLERAKEVISKLYGKVPQRSRSTKMLERILNLVLDYHSEKKI